MGDRSIGQIRLHFLLCDAEKLRRRCLVPAGSIQNHADVARGRGREREVVTRPGSRLVAENQVIRADDRAACHDRCPHQGVLQRRH